MKKVRTWRFTNDGSSALPSWKSVVKGEKRDEGDILERKGTSMPWCTLVVVQKPGWRKGGGRGGPADRTAEPHKSNSPLCNEKEACLPFLHRTSHLASPFIPRTRVSRHHGPLPVSCLSPLTSIPTGISRNFVNCPGRIMSRAIDLSLIYKSRTGNIPNAIRSPRDGDTSDRDVSCRVKGSVWSVSKHRISLVRKVF